MQRAHVGGHCSNHVCNRSDTPLEAVAKQKLVEIASLGMFADLKKTGKNDQYLGLPLAGLMEELGRGVGGSTNWGSHESAAAIMDHKAQ